MDAQANERSRGGGVQPVQAPGGADPGLIEERQRSGGDRCGDHTAESVQLLRAAPHPGAHGARSDRGVEQLGQGGGGTVLGQELAVHQIHPDGSQPRPVLHRGRNPLRGHGPGPRPGDALADDQPVLGDLHTNPLGQVEDLTPLNPDHLGVDQVRPTTGARTLRPVFHLVVRVGDLGQRDAFLPLRTARTAPGPAPQGLRARLTRPSEDGGFEEFFEFWASRASRSAIRTRASANSARACVKSARVAASSLSNPTTNGASFSYAGDGPATDTTPMITKPGTKISPPR